MGILQFDVINASFALAVVGTTEDIFITKSNLFLQFFSGIDKKSILLSLVSQKIADSIILNRKVVVFKEMYWELFVIENIGDYDVYMLKNVSSEFELLKRLKDSIFTLKESSQLFNEIFKQNIPIGILVIDKDYSVIFANNYLKGLFNIPKTASLKKCFNYKKKISPCSDCLLSNFVLDKSKNKQSISEKNKLITSSMFQIKDKYLILFSETTKEINLINEIKKQQTNLKDANMQIALQNDILKKLSDINVQLGIIKEMEPILKKITDSILETFQCKKGAILLKNKKGDIEYAYFSDKIIKNEQLLLLQFVKNKTRSPNFYTILEIKNTENISGKIFLFKPEKKVDKSIVDLFMAQISIYLENIKLHKKLEEAAQVDGLTGVFNRYFLDKKFEEEKLLSKRFRQPLSLILVDVNGLKEANDLIGHEAGDLLIKETATLLKDNVSLYDSVFRLGGDEFVILLVNCPAFHLKIMIEMFKDLQENRNIEINNKRIPVRFSIGGACSSEYDYNELKDQADKEMYRDKETYYENHEKYR